jgi:hypothetical protein
MASKLKIKVNGLVHSVTASLDTPLLYVPHDEATKQAAAVMEKQ